MPSSTPAKIRNSAEAKYQVATSSPANVTVATPPADIAQARSLRLRIRSSAEVVTRDSFKFAAVLFRQTGPGSSGDLSFPGRSAARRSSRSGALQSRGPGCLHFEETGVPVLRSTASQELRHSASKT